MSLTRYWEKRDFSRTSEPKGKPQRKAGYSFVVQKHAARRLHYDFRLELDGVLLSWAVPKGPSLDPSVKRLAVQTEDHPVEYGSFEGIIPAGEYGGGAVVVWDNGHWVPEGDPHKAYAKGHLIFTLEGTKLSGSWHLVRTKGNGKAKSWLLMKRDDASAQRGSDSAVVDEHPESVLSGRTIEAVREDPENVWHSNRTSTAEPKAAARTSTAEPKAAAGTKKQAKARGSRAEPKPTGSSKAKLVKPDPGAAAGAKKAALPSFVEPQLATLATAAPPGDEWIHEIKLDGYRMQLRCDGDKVKVRTRRGHDWTSKLPGLVRELAALKLDRALIDSEVVVLRDGISDFQRLQNSLSDGQDGPCVAYAFDLLHLGDYDLRGVPLLERKELLAATLAAAGVHGKGRIRLSEHVVGHGVEFAKAACELGVEGSICKRADSRYVSGRTKSWLKAKCMSRQEFVIGGFSEPGGSRSHFGALLLGVHEPDGLHYAGRVGTGFSQKSLKELHAKLLPLEQERAPFVNPPTGADAKGVTWLEPKLVAEVSYAERTEEGLVRHASFHGLREDKPAKDVREEVRLEPAQERLLAPGGSANHAGKTKAGKTKAGKTKAGKTKAGAGPKTPPADVAEARLALRSVRLTNPDRILYPEPNLTKADLALYYAQVAELMLVHVSRRPLTLLRCPEGVDGPRFYQKHPTQGISKSIKRVPIRESKGRLDYMYVEDAEGLVQLLQNGALEIHTWGSRIERVEQPDQLTFDLDPDEGLPWERTVEAAHTLKAALEELDLPVFLKTTGGKGLHLVVPIQPSLEWDDAKEFCRKFAESVVRREPDKYLATISKAKRKGKILIDYLRNGRGATAVCAYSTRARPLAPVSAPIEWQELTEDLRPDQFTVLDMPARVSSVDDPWAEFGDIRPKITAAMLRALG